MAKINPIPYQFQKQLSDSSIEIELRAQDFAGITYQEGKSAIAFGNIHCQELIISSNDEIPFEEITLSITESFIGNLVIKDIVTSNLDIYIGSSFLGGKVESENLQSLQLNNCLIRQMIVLTDLKSVRISLSRENAPTTEKWNKNILQQRASYEVIRKEKQHYNISNVKKLDFTSNYPSFAEVDHQQPSVDVMIKYGTDSKDERTNLSNLVLRSLSLSGKPASRITIENTLINQWYIYNFLPKEEVSFFNIEPEANEANPLIGIHQSNLDNVSFDNVYFDKYQIVSFYRAKLAKTTFTSCNFPEDLKSFATFMAINNVHYPEKQPKLKDKDLYELFLQLKKAVENTGNFHEAQKFQALANHSLHNIPTIPGADRFILKTSSLSNNHGLSYLRAIKWLIIFSVVLYALYLLCLGRIFKPTPIDWDLFGYYFSFIDITHRTDFLVDKTALNTGALTVDFVNKIVVGYLIYQFVAAFRKYGKKQ